MNAQNQLVTADELLKMPPEDMCIELVNGLISRRPLNSFFHGEIAANIGAVLFLFIQQNQLGSAYAAGTGFILRHDPDTVRAPDAAFATTERVAAQTNERGFFDGAPDLAVEVVSPSETTEMVEAKLIDYLEAGTKLVWLVYPRTQTIIAYRSLTDVQAFTAADTLTGGDLLPGFAVPVQEIFA